MDLTRVTCPECKGEGYSSLGARCPRCVGVGKAFPRPGAYMTKDVLVSEVPPHTVSLQVRTGQGRETAGALDAVKAAMSVELKGCTLDADGYVVGPSGKRMTEADVDRIVREAAPEVVRVEVVPPPACDIDVARPRTYRLESLMTEPTGDGATILAKCPVPGRLAMAIVGGALVYVLRADHVTAEQFNRFRSDLSKLHREMDAKPALIIQLPESADIARLVPDDDAASYGVPVVQQVIDRVGVGGMKAVETLKALEWGVKWSPNYGECPWCSRTDADGEHTYDCKLAEVIGAKMTKGDL